MHERVERFDAPEDAQTGSTRKIRRRGAMTAKGGGGIGKIETKKKQLENQ